MESIKVLILHKWLVIGGIETVLETYKKILLSLGYKVEILITYQTKYKEDNNISYFLSKDSFDKLVKLKENRNVSFFKKITYEIASLYIKYKYNRYISKKSKNYDYIIDFSECLNSYIRSTHSRKNRHKFIRWIHSQIENNKKNTKKYKKIFNNFSKIITICPEMQSVIHNRFHVPLNMISCIFNPIDLEKIRMKSLLTEEKYATLLNQKYFLQVSRIVKGKGHEELLEIFSSLKRKGLPHKLYFLGNGENKENLKKLVDHLNINNEVLFLDEIENPYPFFKNADLFLHCSESEGLPTVILESMALGVPVVAMDCHTGPKDILGIKSEYGKLIPLHNKKLFISAVLDLLDNPEIYQYYKKISLQRINDFSEKKISLELKKIFK